MQSRRFWFIAAVNRRLPFEAMLVLGTALLGVSAEAVGDDSGNGADGVSNEINAASADSLVVEVQEGAASPREAIAAFAAASGAGDVEAALALIDPQVRRLLQVEVLLEEYLLDRHLLRNRLMTEKQRTAPWNNLGAFPLVYAMRDLVRTSRIDVVKEQSSTASRDRVLIDVDWQVFSWDRFDADHEFDTVTVTILAVRHGDRWYLFHPFGSHFAGLLESEFGSRDGETVLRSERDDRPDATGTEFSVTYLVPIESVHEELVVAAQSPETAELFDQAQKLVRFKDAVRAQATRGDFHDLGALDQVLALGDPVFERLVVQFLSRLRSAADELVRYRHQEPDAE